MLSDARFPDSPTESLCEEVSPPLGRFVISPRGYQTIGYSDRDRERTVSDGYHGTTVYAAEQIIRKGFRGTDYGPQNGVVVYFASDPLSTSSFAQSRSVDQPYAVLHAWFPPMPDAGHMAFAVPERSIPYIRVFDVTAYNSPFDINQAETNRLRGILREVRDAEQ